MAGNLPVFDVPHTLQVDPLAFHTVHALHVQLAEVVGFLADAPLVCGWPGRRVPHTPQLRFGSALNAVQAPQDHLPAPSTGVATEPRSGVGGAPGRTASHTSQDSVAAALISEHAAHVQRSVTARALIWFGTIVYRSQIKVERLEFARNSLAITNGRAVTTLRAVPDKTRAQLDRTKATY
jgi:hypothetical protein